MTAEECLLCSRFAMVSSDCHVRNAHARTTGLGMLPSETSLADEMWNLHLSTELLVHLYILFTVFLNSCSLSQSHHKVDCETTKSTKSRTFHNQNLKTSLIIIG